MSFRGLLQRLPLIGLAALVVFAFAVSTAVPAPAAVESFGKAECKKLPEKRSPSDKER